MRGLIRSSALPAKKALRHMPTVLKDSRQRYLPYGQAIYVVDARYVTASRDMFASRTRANIISHWVKRNISQLQRSYIAFCRKAKYIAFWRLEHKYSVCLNKYKIDWNKVNFPCFSRFFVIVFYPLECAPQGAEFLYIFSNEILRVNRRKTKKNEENKRLQRINRDFCMKNTRFFIKIAWLFAVFGVS